MSQAWIDYLNRHQDRFVEEYLDLLRIPSVSTLPEHKADVRRAAEWTADRLRRAGVEGVEILETAGHPVVCGEWLHAPGRPTLLFYGHFDVQPADPLELWTSPPFEPALRDGKVYARGSSDMKGNLLLPLLACEALLQTTGTLPVNVKFLYEGEEEIGSKSLEPFVMARRDRLACDLVVSADSGQHDEGQPAVPVSVRGLCALEISVKTAAIDLHSGTGGMAPNPIHALVQILDSMRAADGRILVAGFYDEVVPLSEADRAAIAAVPFQADEIRSRTGIREFFGEAGFTPMEAVGARPTLEVNGIWGGYQGAGTKTVIPCEAHAKITCRLVPDQRPEQIAERVRAHVRKAAPSYAEVNVADEGERAYPYMIAREHPAVRLLHRVLEGMYGNEPWYVRGGGSVPALGMFHRLMQVDAVSLGFSLQDEPAHSPNEFYRLSSFAKGQEAYCRFIQEIGAHLRT